MGGAPFSPFSLLLRLSSLFLYSPRHGTTSGTPANAHDPAMLSNDPTYPLFPILAFLSSVLALLPVPFALQVWNTGACALAAWTATACLLSFINSVVWAGNVMDIVPVWCDICA